MSTRTPPAGHSPRPLSGGYISDERRSHAGFLQSLANAEKIQANRGNGFFAVVSGGMVGLGEPAQTKSFHSTLTAKGTGVTIAHPPQNRFATDFARIFSGFIRLFLFFLF